MRNFDWLTNITFSRTCAKGVALPQCMHIRDAFAMHSYHIKDASATNVYIFSILPHCKY